MPRRQAVSRSAEQQERPGNQSRSKAAQHGVVHKPYSGFKGQRDPEAARPSRSLQTATHAPPQSPHGRF